MSGLSRGLPEPSPDCARRRRGSRNGGGSLCAFADDDLRPRRPGDGGSEHRIQQGFGVGSLRQPPKNVGKPAIEQQHGETVDQRPGARDRRGLIERQRLFGNLLLPVAHRSRRRDLRTTPWRPHAATAATYRAARCGTSDRTCRDGPAHRRHRPWPAPSPAPPACRRRRPAAAMAALNCRNPIAASSLTRPVRSPK